jgi:hypothetical protein
MKSTIMNAAFQPQDWPSSIWLLLLTGVVTLVAQLAWKPAFGPKAPPYVKFGDSPILGAWQYFGKRYDFFRANQAASKTGNFSFFVGKLPVVAITGHEGRKTYFDTKELNMGAGYVSYLCQ